MAMSTRMSTEQTDEAKVSDAYEPPSLVKHGSLSELTLEATTTSGGGSPWCGGGGGSWGS